jgi:hypothetical protein
MGRVLTERDWKRMENHTCVRKKLGRERKDGAILAGS